MRIFFSVILLSGFMLGIAQKVPISFQCSYAGDFIVNSYSGVNQGFTYLGKIGVGINFSTEAARWWRGGNFFVSGENIYCGEKLPIDLIGEFQKVSNIDADRQVTCLKECWFEQSFEKIAFKVGLQDLNHTYAFATLAGDLINSTFGLNSVIASNFAVPSFPNAALAFNFSWKFLDKWEWHIGIFDGDPTDKETNPHNLQWQLSSNDGSLTITEFQFCNDLKNKYLTTCKFGFFYHSQAEKWGVYSILEQNFTEKMGGFVQVAYTPKRDQNNYLNVSTGIHYSRCFSEHDSFSFGLTTAFFSKELGNETILELTYKYGIFEPFYIQPSVQFVVHPAGTDVKLDYALPLLLRVGVDL